MKLPRQLRAATLESNSYNEDDNTIDVVWTTGADVLRCDPFDGSTYIERLLTGPKNVRLARLNAGASFLDAHNSSECAAVIGSVVPKSARMDGGLGLCRIKLSKSERAADTVTDIRDNIIKNVSVGYSVFTFTRTEATDGSPAILTATDWEPCEISAVPVPADAGAQIRSAMGCEINTVIITRADEAPTTDKKEPILADEDTKINKNDKPDDKKVDTDKKIEKIEKDDKDLAAEKHGLKKDDIIKVDGNVIVTKDNHEITDPGDAYPTKVTERELKRMMQEAVASERVRMNEIMNLTRKFNLENLGRYHAERGSSLKHVKDAILESLAERSAENPIISAHVEVESLNKKAPKNDRAAGEEWARKFAPNKK